MEALGRIYHFYRDFETLPCHFRNVMVYQLGDICCEVGYEVEAHEQWCYEITYVKSGEGTMFTDGVAWPVRANDIYINGRDDVHMIRADCGSQLRYLYIGFDVPDMAVCEPQLREVLKHFGTTKAPCAQDRTGVGEVFGRMVQEFYWDQPCFKEIVASYIELILYLTYRNAVSHTALLSTQTVAAGNVGVTVYLIIRYVDDHICEIRSIRDLAEKLGYSYTYISHLFRNKTGITLRRYIHNKKMVKAVELLTEAGLTATQTAERLGYQSVQAFSKIFRSIYGVSPTAYLKGERGAEG